MKIAAKRPKAVKRPVYLTKDKLELWYLKPVMLGEVVKDGLFWHTKDGMRFNSSRDALEYCLRMYEMEQGIPQEERSSEELPVTRRKRKQKTVVANPAQKKQELFEQFIEFINTKQPPIEGGTRK